MGSSRRKRTLLDSVWNAVIWSTADRRRAAATTQSHHSLGLFASPSLDIHSALRDRPAAPVERRKLGLFNLSHASCSVTGRCQNPTTRGCPTGSHIRQRSNPPAPLHVASSSRRLMLPIAQMALAPRRFYEPRLICRHAAQAVGPPALAVFLFIYRELAGERGTGLPIQGFAL